MHGLILIGNNEITYTIVKFLQNNRNYGYKVIGVVDSSSNKKVKKGSYKILGKIKIKIE